MVTMPASNYSVGRQTPGEGRYEFQLLHGEQDLPSAARVRLFRRHLSVCRLRWDGRPGIKLCFCAVIYGFYRIQRSFGELGIVFWWLPGQRKRLFRRLDGERLRQRIIVR